MRILWITNIILPPVCTKFDLPQPVMGGWMYSLLESLIKQSDIQFAVAAVYSGKKMKKTVVDNVTYYLLPSNGNNFKYNSTYESFWKKIKIDFAPIIVHLHGTEYAHGLSFLKVCPEVKAVISIQGLVSICAFYYYGGISVSKIFRNITFRDLIKRDSLFQAKNRMGIRGINERILIRHTNHIIGRTNWDKAHTKFINPFAEYHFCNETLRGGFYERSWEFDNCEKYSIFLSQASYPIKGLHQVLKAVSLLKLKFPKIKIKISGQDITASKSLKDKIKISGYGNLIKKEIKNLALENHIEFVGVLNEKDMINQYLSSNIFICPSSIENSPNSLGEAQILGVPLISSYVGGIPDMVEHGVSGFMYRFEEIEMLAFNIEKVFLMNKKELQILSKNERKSALHRHNRGEIAKQMIAIYTKIFLSK